MRTFATKFSDNRNCRVATAPFLCRGLFAVFALALFTCGSAIAQAQSSDALAGQVSSKEEAGMEGVLVTAKKVGSNVATTVVSDAKGHYAFPTARLQPGQYNVRIRAVGYDLENPGPVDVSGTKTT